MSTLYLGIRLPEKPYERLKLNDINFSTKNVVDLKIDAEKLLNFSHTELEFIYCGNVLENDNQSLQEYGIRAGTTIHVFQKQHDVEYKSEPATEEQIQKAVQLYRSTFKDLAGNTMAKTVRPEVLKKVVEAYPEYNSNLGAYAILRDSILIQPLSLLETAKKIAKEYPILIHSAEFVTKTMREHFAANKPNLLQSVATGEDSLSDSSSSEGGDTPMTSPNQRAGDIRQISRDQLSQALRLAGSSSLNSLLNISQRNSGSSQSSIVPSTSLSSSSTGTSSAGGALSGLISNSLLTNALSQALLSSSAAANLSGSNAISSQPAPAATAILPSQQGSNENLAERYATELQTMREMGLFEEITNIQALVVSNGDVEAAINLVLSGLGNLN